MHRKFGPAALAGSLAVGVCAFGVALPNSASALPTPAVTLCVAEGGGDIVLNGPSYFDSGPLKATVSGTDNVSYNATTDTYTGNYNVSTTPSCVTVPSVRNGDYTAYAAGNLDGPCYRTVDGDLINPPYIVGATGNAADTPRCPGKVYSITESVNGTPVAPIIHQDTVSFAYTSYDAVTLTFRITDNRLPDCVTQYGPYQSSAQPAASAGTCQQNGPTINPPA